MRHHLILWPLLLLLTAVGAMAQNVKRQTDQHVIHQQERMVHKQWDRNKFTPRKGFLNLDYRYWITWALHPSYPRTDHRPLSAAGPQTLRMALVLAMQHTDNAYKAHSDTLRNTAASEAMAHSGLASAADPLWQLYYRRELEGLADGGDPLDGLPPAQRDYLRERGVLEWYNEERAELAERLEAARSADMDRGSRLMAYHRMLGEYRRLADAWEAKKRNAAKYLDLMAAQRKLTTKGTDDYNFTPGRSDIQIADGVLARAYKTD